MTWSLILFGGLTILITVVALVWIWAESKPGTIFKGRSDASNGIVSHQGMEKE